MFSHIQRLRPKIDFFSPYDERFAAMLTTCVRFTKHAFRVQEREENVRTGEAPLSLSTLK